MFSILDPVRTRESLDPIVKPTDWELFQNLASELMSPNIWIHSSNEADKAARDFAASIAVYNFNKLYLLLKAVSKSPFSVYSYLDIYKMKINFDKTFIIGVCG
jgi:hypothetical protein